jgi:hypothetical protein
MLFAPEIAAGDEPPSVVALNSVSDGIIGALSLSRPPERRKSRRSSGVITGRSTCRTGLRISAAVKALTVRFMGRFWQPRGVRHYPPAFRRRSADRRARVGRRSGAGQAIGPASARR